MSDESETVHTDGGVSAFTGEPFVIVRSARTDWQWTPAEARAFAVLLIRTAGAAEADAEIVAECEGAGMDDQTIGGFLSAIRRRRDRRG